MARPRLLREVVEEQVPTTDVVLACAPAGYGKTTMLARFAAEQRALGVPVAWVTCDRDDDSRAFWSAVVVATARAAEDAGGSAAALTALRAPMGPVGSHFVATLL